MTKDGKREKAGRPPYEPTQADREVVEQMKFCGESDLTIARALRIDPDTLRKYYADQIADGVANKKREVFGLLFETARKGNVAAIKKLEELGRVGGASEAVKTRTRQAPAIGKKQERKEAAEKIGGKYATRPVPLKLAVSNK